jgi:hypothetical protein
MFLEIQRRQIKGFIRKGGRKQIDAFGIYLWIERCHYQGWWDLGSELSSYLPPNSLSPDYQKRLEYLANDCRNKLAAEFISLKSPQGSRAFYVPKSFWNACQELGISPGGKSDRWLRLEYEGQEVIILEKIKLESCLLKFSKWKRESLIEWLNSRGLGHLSANVLPRGEKASRNCWIIIAWNQATDLLPALKEIAHNKAREKEKAIFSALAKIPENAKLRLGFLSGLFIKFKERHLFPNNALLTYSGTKVTIDKALGLAIYCTVFEHLVRLGILINKGSKSKAENKALFDKLFSIKDQIEEEFGEPVFWERLDEKTGCRISTIISIGGYKDKDKWNEITDTIIIGMQKFDSKLKCIMGRTFNEPKGTLT